MKIADDAADPKRTIKPKYVIALGICLLALGGYLASQFLGGPESPGSMAARALSAGDLKERKQAAVDLASVVDRVAALPHLRHVAKETKDAETLVVVLPRLLYFRDRDSLPTCFAALSHPSKEVREQVSQGLRAYYSGSLPEGVEYAVDAPAEDLARVVAKLNEYHSRRRSSPGAVAAPGPAVASAKKEEPAAAAPKKDEPGTAAAKKDDAEPASAPSIAPSPSAQPPPPLMPMENPAINLLAWMFRGLAVIVLLADLAGAIGLMFSDRPTKVNPTADQPPSLAEEVARIVADNSTGLYQKVALLIAGAICAAALLMAAELSQLAVRLEQKIDSVSPNR